MFYSVMARVLEASVAFSYTVDFSALEWLWGNGTVDSAAAPLSQTSAYTNPILQAVRVAVHQALVSGEQPCASVFGASEHSVTIVAHETLPEASQGTLSACIALYMCLIVVCQWVASPCSTVVIIVAVPIYPKCTPPAARNWAHILCYFEVLRYSPARTAFDAPCVYPGGLRRSTDRT